MILSSPDPSPTLVPSNHWLPLWSENEPSFDFLATWSEHLTEEGFYTEVNHPSYQMFHPPEGTANGSGVIIFPGGGYSILAAEHEGIQYAKQLNAWGYTCMLVKYRVSKNLNGKALFPLPLLDARRALRTFRSNAVRWGVSPHKIGVMGSSAGGHLASMTATLFDHSFDFERRDTVDQFSARPNFAALIYPVTTTTDPWSHVGTIEQLFGKETNNETVRIASSAKQLNPNTCPCFLVHAANDPEVPIQNSIEFASACSRLQVPMACHLFTTGGHGFGLGINEETKQWPGMFKLWLGEIGMN